MADAGSAAFRVSGLELGGLFGSLLAGRISDSLIARDPKGGNCGKRVQVCSLTQTLHASSGPGMSVNTGQPLGRGCVIEDACSGTTSCHCCQSLSGTPCSRP